MHQRGLIRWCLCYSTHAAGLDMANLNGQRDLALVQESV